MSKPKSRTWNGKTLKRVASGNTGATFTWSSQSEGTCLRIDVFAEGCAYARAEFAGGLILSSGKCKTERAARKSVDDQLRALDRYVSEVLYGN